MKKRNPVAKNLNINKPKIIPDKRRKVREKLQEQENNDQNYSSDTRRPCDTEA